MSRLRAFLSILLMIASSVAAQNYTFTTLAGAAPHGSDDGFGSAARFSLPGGVATDRAGNIYVADTDNYTIRRISPDGRVTTLAGVAGSPGSVDGPGSFARFFRPQGIAVDSNGNVYVGDGGIPATSPGNCTIRRITPDGVVSTFAGTQGQAG